MTAVLALLLGGLIGGAVVSGARQPDRVARALAVAAWIALVALACVWLATSGRQR